MIYLLYQKQPKDAHWLIGVHCCEGVVVMIMMATMIMMVMMTMMKAVIKLKDAPVLHWWCIQCPEGD